MGRMKKVLASSFPVQIERATAPTDEVRALIGELDRELAEHYEEAQRHGLALDAIFQPHIRFFVARMNGSAVGCGGVALFADFAELKRMYVRPDARGQGVADSILGQLVSEAADAGRNVVRLETGTHQLAAIRFYERAGFQACDAFGAYALMPPEAVEQSVFMERLIAAPMSGGTLDHGRLRADSQ